MLHHCNHDIRFYKILKKELLIKQKIGMVLIFVECSQIENIESILVFFVYFVQYFFMLKIGFGFVVFDCIWEHGLNIVFENLRRVLKNVPEV